LLADGQPAAPAADTMAPADAQGLLDYALTLIEGGELMFTMEVPYVPAQETPIVLVQAETASAPPAPDSVLNVCRETASQAQFAGTAIRGIDPVVMLANALNSVTGKPVVMDYSVIKNITLLEGTKHGELLTRTASDGRTTFRYNPIPNYVGEDRAVFMAEFEGKRYKIVVNLKVSLGVDYNDPLCPENPYELIKVTKPSSGASGIDTVYSLGTVSVTFADLPVSAVGQAVGTTITLDNNAAGNGWYIDGTPWDNSEFLPTSNPNEWVAKAGSAAAGKMDMLSVLLHEYGHALGIDHSADSHDYMATTLTAGAKKWGQIYLKNVKNGDRFIYRRRIERQGPGRPTKRELPEL
jgi:hypothetical protein